jgi:hypothetical protein
MSVCVPKVADITYLEGLQQVEEPFLEVILECENQ